MTERDAETSALAGPAAKAAASCSGRPPCAPTPGRSSTARGSRLRTVSRTSGCVAPTTAPTEESPLALTRRARRINRELAELYPDAHCELDFTTPLELAVATILSAQCTDKRVNEVTPAVFARYPTAADYAGADRDDLEKLIKPTGFFRNKTTSLIKLGQALVERFDGVLPDTLDELVTLPGFGRKTANVVLNIAFGEPTIAVDTHIFRVGNRTGVATGKTPLEVEEKLERVVPDAYKRHAHHWLILHGRYTCVARKPRCEVCLIADLCKWPGKTTA